jgi:hypothetical protein
MLLKEHRFKFIAGVSIHLFIIEEMVTGLAMWPQRFRLKLPASSCSEAKTFYGDSCDEVAEKASGFMASNSGQPVIDRPSRRPKGPPDYPRHILHTQELD